VTVVKYEDDIIKLLIEQGRTLYREGIENLLGINRIKDKDRKQTERRLLQKALRKLRKQRLIVALPEIVEDKPGNLTLKFSYRRLTKEEESNSIHSETYLALRHLYRTLQRFFEEHP
jgi:hypothetical protein